MMPKKLSQTVILIGFMGSGKSHVARLVSKSFDVPVIDLDARIEAACGSSIADVFTHHGEKYFREKETATLREVLRETSRAVAIIATGGGVVTGEANRRLLQEAAQLDVLVVYLRAEPATLAERIRQEPGKRPLIDGEKILDIDETNRRVKVLLENRSALYESCANLIIDTDLLKASQVAEIIKVKAMDQQ